MKIFLAGATGAIGRPLTAQLVSAETNRLRRDGTRNLIDAALAAGARRFIAQSIAFAYAPGGSGPATEDAPLYMDAPSSFADVIHALRSLEEATLGSAELTGIVLRYGFFYGPGTGYAADGSFAEDVRHRRVPIVGKGEGVFSLIHVEDAAAATVAAVERGDPGIYNIVDDDPAPVSEWLPIYAQILGARRPLRVPRWLAQLLVGSYAIYLMCDQRGASNAKAKRVLGWSPRYSSWREGFQQLAAGST